MRFYIIKKAFCLLLVIVLLSSFMVTYADDTVEREALLADAVMQMEKYDQEIKNLYDNIEDEDSRLLLNYASQIILTAQEGLLKDMENPTDDIFFESVESFRTSYMDEDGYIIYNACLHKLEGVSVYGQADVIIRDGFLLSRYSLYDDDGEYLGTVRVEIGHRENEWIILIVDYDNLDTTTGRFAIKIADNHPQVIFTKTLGVTLGIVLDVDSWQKGEDIGAWDKSLLLPASILFG